MSTRRSKASSLKEKYMQWILPYISTFNCAIGGSNYIFLLITLAKRIVRQKEKKKQAMVFLDLLEASKSS